MLTWASLLLLVLLWCDCLKGGECSVVRDLGSVNIVSDANTIPLRVKGTLNQATLMVQAITHEDANIFSVSTAGAVVTTGGLSCGGNLGSSGTSVTVDSLGVGTGSIATSHVTAATVTITNDAAGQVPVELKGTTSQSGNLLLIETSAGVDKLTISASGTLTVDGDISVEDVFCEAFDVTGTLDAAAFTSHSASITSTANTITVMIRGHASQAVNLMSIQESDGTSVMSVSQNGAVNFAGTLTSANNLDGGFNWNQVSGSPTTVDDYGINDAGYSSQTNNVNNCVKNANGINWGAANSKPTTIAGFGITSTNMGGTNWATINQYNSVATKAVTTGCAVFSDMTKGDVYHSFNYGANSKTNNDWGDTYTFVWNEVNHAYNNNFPTDHVGNQYNNLKNNNQANNAFYFATYNNCGCCSNGNCN